MKARKKRPGVSKAEKLRVAQRIEEVLRLRLGGVQFWDVREYVREKEQEDGSPWKRANRAKPLSDSQLRRYIQRADALLLASVKEPRSKAIRRHLARRESLYAQAYHAGDIRTALAVAQDEAKLRGLYPAEKHKVKVKGRVQADLTIVELTDDERRAAITALFARVGATSPRPDLAGTRDPARPAV